MGAKGGVTVFTRVQETGCGTGRIKALFSAPPLGLVGTGDRTAGSAASVLPLPGLGSVRSMSPGYSADKEPVKGRGKLLRVGSELRRVDWLLGRTNGVVATEWWQRATSAAFPQGKGQAGMLEQRSAGRAGGGRG